MKKIFTELAEIKRNYHDQIVITDGLLFSQYMQLKTCEFYSNSKYLEGNKDGLDRDKPFYNIVNFRVTLAKVATDLDIKDVQITSDNPEHYVESMLLQHESYEWMKETDFGLFLNRMGHTRAKYGGVLVKKVIDSKKGMNLEIPEWKNVWTDQIDIMNGSIVECHYLTPVQLAAKDDAWNNVMSALKELKNVKNKDKSNRIEIYEIHGQFPQSVYKDAENEKYTDEDEYVFSQQKYFVGNVNKKEFIFYCEDDAEFPYKYLAWEEMSGRALGRGVIEDSEESQIWTNDAVINETNAMALAGKVVIKTNSKKIGNNILEVDNGRILELDAGEDVNAVNLEPAAIGEFQNQIERWMTQADKATSSFDANTGEQPPADTPYSQTALLNQVASKPFDYRREEAGIFVTELFEDWVIPYLVKKIKKKHILVSEYSEDELEVIDQAFATYSVNQKAQEAILAGRIVTPDDYQTAIQGYRDLLKGTRRFLEIPDGFFDDVKAKVSVITTNEQRDKAAILTSLSTILKDVSGTFNPQTGTFAMLDNPILAKIFGTILELSGSGLSPVSLGIGKEGSAQSQSQPQQAPVAPNGAPQNAQPVAPVSPMQPAQPASPTAVSPISPITKI